MYHFHLFNVIREEETNLRLHILPKGENTSIIVSLWVRDIYYAKYYGKGGWPAGEKMKLGVRENKGSIFPF